VETIPDWLLDEFNALNARHFGGLLPRPRGFRVNDLGYKAFYVPEVRLFFFHRRTLDQDRKFISDTLLHEMIHCALELETGDHAQDHGQPFVDRANAIGATLGLRSVELGTDEVLDWPQSVRPPDYCPWV
jgi:SprT-like family